MALVLEVATENEWHIMKGETQYGPFTYPEVLGMLQNKTLFSFDFIWAGHLDSWTMLGDLPEFSVDRITRIVQQSKDQKVFNKRAHKRAGCDMSVYAHDDLKLWNGTVSSVSIGGVLMLIDNPFLLPGDQLTVHFRKDSPMAKGFAVAFNTRMEVLNKRLSKQKLSYDSRLHYVLQFTQLPDAGEKLIADFVKKSLKNTQGE